MATRKRGARKPRSSGKKTPRHSVLGPVLFIVFLLVVLITAFFVLLPVVRGNLSGPPRTITGQPPPQEPVTPVPPPQTQSPPDPTPPPAETPMAALPDTPQEVTETEDPMELEPVSLPEPPAPPPAESPPATRDRSIYFMRAERDGAELRLVLANRSLRVSNTPLQDSLNALLSGPTAEERNRGLLSFIPPGARMISDPVIRGNTAHLNFNEEFRYNTSGREGCVAQVQQIVWTATEFPNVHNVQFLIEGKVVDFLSEGVMIGSPIGR